MKFDLGSTCGVVTDSHAAWTFLEFVRVIRDSRPVQVARSEMQIGECGTAVFKSGMGRSELSITRVE